MDYFEMDGLDNVSLSAMEADWAALTRIALLKMAGVFMVSINRLGGETSIQPRSFDLSALCDHVGKSIIFRFRTLKRIAPGLEIDVDVETGTKTQMMGREALIYLVIMNILKNAPKIMAERKTPEEKQKINLQLFERKGVLFFHYEDEAGGIDITRLLAASVRTIQNRTQASAQDQLSPTLKVIRGGAFQAAEQLTLQSICDLIFEQYVTARQGGSGLGLHEAKDLLSEHGAYIQATPTLRNGTQFLIAFPQDEVEPGDLQRIIHEVKVELDQKEATALKLVG
jgi:signal transduction histidine kinase